MIFATDNHARRSIRLKGYDYSTPGAYFATICIHEKKPFLGKIVNGEVHLNPAGSMVEKWFRKLPSKFHGLECDAFVCMPNHVHFIIILYETHSLHSSVKISLHTAIQWFKTMTTNEYIREVNLGSYQPFEKRLWQRNYWEHIIRDEKELNQTREYIESNPLQWDSDEFFLP